MEPLPGIVATAVLFDRASGARLEAAERYVRSLPSLFPGVLVGCDLGFKGSASIAVVVMRFAERGFGAAVRRRLDFWCARAGVRAIGLDTMTAEQRSSFFGNLDRCAPKITGIAPDRLISDSVAFFTQAGAPEDRRLPGVAPLLAMDVGGPGWSGVRYDNGDRTLFIPGLLGPPAGDELTAAFRFPGMERPLESQAVVVSVSAGDGSASAPAGFALALTNPPPALLLALTMQQPPPPSQGQRRVHQRYSVKAPVTVTGPDEAPPAEAAPSPLAPLAGEGEPPVPGARIEYESDQELEAD